MDVLPGYQADYKALPIFFQESIKINKLPDMHNFRDLLEVVERGARHSEHRLRAPIDRGRAMLEVWFI